LRLSDIDDKVLDRLPHRQKRKTYEKVLGSALEIEHAGDVVGLWALLKLVKDARRRWPHYTVQYQTPAQRLQEHREDTLHFRKLVLQAKKDITKDGKAVFSEEEKRVIAEKYMGGQGPEIWRDWEEKKGGESFF